MEECLGRTPCRPGALKVSWRSFSPAVPVIRVAVFENGGALLVAPNGNADRKARFRWIVSDLRREFELKAD
jgi:hypothetical protein